MKAHFTDMEVEGETWRRVTQTVNSVLHLKKKNNKKKTGCSRYKMRKKHTHLNTHPATTQTDIYSH